LTKVDGKAFYRKEARKKRQGRGARQGKVVKKNSRGRGEKPFQTTEGAAPKDERKNEP